MFSSKTDLWATPQEFFDKYNAIHHFTLDVCATDENAKCKNYFTESDDGLKQVWTGNFWMNPPYGREISYWIEKAYLSVYNGTANKVVCLLPSRTDTRWFHDYCMHGKLEFIKGRLKFGEATNSAPFPSVVVVVFEGKLPRTEGVLRLELLNTIATSVDLSALTTDSLSKLLKIESLEYKKSDTKASIVENIGIPELTKLTKVEILTLLGEIYVR